jgi:hypothetical protein
MRGMALNMNHGFAALLTMAYGMGSPDVAPMLPRTMELAFAKLHKEFNVIGSSVYQSTAAAAESASRLVASEK